VALVVASKFNDISNACNRLPSIYFKHVYIENNHIVNDLAKQRAFGEDDFLLVIVFLFRIYYCLIMIVGLVLLISFIFVLMSLLSNVLNDYNN
jgi:hypothetical protein